MTELDYWKECILLVAEECELILTKEQLEMLAESVQGGHDNYGMAFYSPPSSDRLNVIQREGDQKLKQLQAEFDDYRTNAEKAVKRALRTYSDAIVSIHPYGEVLIHNGRTERIQ